MIRCPNCKNPILETHSVCEWCGTSIQSFVYSVSNNLIPPKSTIKPSAKTINFNIRFDGWALLGKRPIEVFIDSFFVGEGDFTKGFNIEFQTENSTPNIQIKSAKLNTKIQLPSEISFNPGESYTIVLDYSWWTNTGISKQPKRIIKNNME